MAKRISVPKNSIDVALGAKVPDNSITSGGNYFKVCTNSMSIMGESQVHKRNVSQMPTRNRVVVIYEDDANDEYEEDKVEVIVMKHSGKHSNYPALAITDLLSLEFLFKVKSH